MGVGEGEKGVCGINAVVFSRVVIVDVLLRDGHIGIWFQVGTDPINSVINLTACSQWVLWLTKGV